MKKLLHFFQRIFQALAMIVEFLLFPIISFRWYRACRAKGDSDMIEFAFYGVLGAIGIASMIAMWYTPLLWSGLLAFVALLTYGLGGARQVSLIMEKVKKRNNRATA